MAPGFTPRRLPTISAAEDERSLVLLVDDPEVIDLVAAGSTHEAAYAAGMNVHFIAPMPGEVDAITMRVWERGAGETQACGSGACAAMAVLRQRQQVDAEVEVVLPGGSLEISWQGAGHTLSMTGPAAFVFEGVWHD